MSLKVNFDEKSLLINGKREFILSAAIHYYRLPAKECWADRIKKIKEAGLNAVDVYFAWNYHSPKENIYDFNGNRDVDYLMQLIEDESLYLIARPGPYICSEVDGGGFPGWLIAKNNLILRCRENNQYIYDEKYVRYVQQWYEQIVPKIVARKNLILFQIENEYNFLPLEGAIKLAYNLIKSVKPSLLFDIMVNPYFKKMAKKFLFDEYKKTLKSGKTQGDTNDYMKRLGEISKALGVQVPLFHNDTLNFGARQLDVDIMAIDDYSVVSLNYDWRGNENIFTTVDMMEQGLRTFPKKCPLFIAEMQGGWFDFWGSSGYPKMREHLNVDQIDLVTKSVLAQGASLYNYFMFVGGTTYGYLGSPDVYTSYDFAAPISEGGNKINRYYAVKKIAEFLKKEGDELLNAEKDDISFSCSDLSVLNAVRSSNQKKYVFLRNLSNKNKKVLLSSTKPLKVKMPKVSAKILVFDNDDNLIAKCGVQKKINETEQDKIILPESLPVLEKWEKVFTSQQILNNYNDDNWEKVSAYDILNMDACGVHYGFIWYRGKFYGKMQHFEIDARHLYSVYLNGKEIFSYNNFANYLGVGNDFSRKKVVKIPEELCKEENILTILVESLGHNKCVEDDAQNPRGLVAIDTKGKLSSFKVRGGLIEGEEGITPVVDFFKLFTQQKETIEFPYTFKDNEEGIFLFKNNFSFASEKIKDYSLGLEILNTNNKINIYLNGYLIGRFWAEKGPQKVFYLPWGILKEKDNEIVLAYWKRFNKGEIGEVKLVKYF